MSVTKTAMINGEREELIRAAIKKCLDKGVKLGIQCWGLYWNKTKKRYEPRKDATCCALSCVLLANQDTLRENEIGWRAFSLRKLLETDEHWIHSFQQGFDAYSMTKLDDEDAYMLGKLMREEFLQ